jgi:hypothetical protein
MAEMEFASPVGMSLTNKATWETLVHGRGGMAMMGAASPGMMMNGGGGGNGVNGGASPMMMAGLAYAGGGGGEGGGGGGGAGGATAGMTTGGGGGGGGGGYGGMTGGMTPARPLALAANFFSGAGASALGSAGGNLSRLGKRTAAQRRGAAHVINPVAP